MNVSQPEDLPAHLYRYRSLSGDKVMQYAEALIVHGEFFFPPPAWFNDPFDCAPVLSLDGATDDELRVHWEEELRNEPNRERLISNITTRATHPELWARHLRETNRALREDVRNDIGVLSLCEVKDDILMWSHYADHHRGFCVCFDFAENVLFENVQRVEYADERPAINRAHGDDKRTAMLKGLLTKSTHWQYEKEWRWLLIRHGAYRLPLETVSGVILGAEMSEPHRKQMREWVAKRGRPLDIYQAYIEESRYALRIEQT